jgi:hypothetical protein
MADSTTTEHTEAEGDRRTRLIARYNDNESLKSIADGEGIPYSRLKKEFLGWGVHLRDRGAARKAYAERVKRSEGPAAR